MCAWVYRLHAKQQERSECARDALFPRLVHDVIQVVHEYARVQWFLVSPGNPSIAMRCEYIWFRDMDMDEQWERLPCQQRPYQMVADHRQQLALVRCISQEGPGPDPWLSIGMLFDHGHPTYHLQAKGRTARLLFSHSCIDDHGNIYAATFKGPLQAGDQLVRLNCVSGKVPTMEPLTAVNPAGTLLSPPVVLGSRLYWRRVDHLGVGAMYSWDLLDPDATVKRSVDLPPSAHGHLYDYLIAFNGQLHTHHDKTNWVLCDGEWKQYASLHRPRLGHGVAVLNDHQLCVFGGRVSVSGESGPEQSVEVLEYHHGREEYQWRVMPEWTLPVEAIGLQCIGMVMSV